MPSSPTSVARDLPRIAELAALVCATPAAVAWLGDARAGHGLGGQDIERATLLARRLAGGGDAGGVAGACIAAAVRDAAGRLVGGVAALEPAGRAPAPHAQRALALLAEQVGARLAAEARAGEASAREQALAEARRELDAQELRAHERERSLEASEARARLIIDTALDAIVAADADGRITEWNPRAEAIFGWSRAEALGRDLLALILPPDERAGGGARAGLKRFLASGRTMALDQRSEIRCVRRDGTAFPAEIAVSALRVGDDLAFSAFVRDVGERTRAGDELRAVLEASPVAVVVLEGDQATMHNAAAAELFGLGRDGRIDAARLIAAMPELRELVAHAIEGGSFTAIASRFAPDGAPRPRDVLLSVAPLGADGRGRRVLVAAADVSERKDLERQLFQAQKMEAIGKLAGGVAHDFNNLLMVINGRAELIAQRLAADAPARRDAELIVETAARAARLTRQLLAFSRRQPFAAREIDLNETVGEMTKMLRSLVGEDVVLALALDPRLPRIVSDPAHVEQVLLNLVVNARDAMRSGGDLRIATRPVEIDARRPDPSGAAPGLYAALIVADSGVGMDEATRARIFEPFFTTKGNGTGLGLSTVYGIVQQNGGSIRVDSEPGRGATFTILFPASTSPAAPRVAEGGDAHHAAGGAGESVLVVEDEEPVRDLVREVLAGAGYRVSCAARPSDAVALAQREPGFDLLLSDLVMPQTGGRELAERLRTLWPSLRVLFMSGYAEGAVDRGDAPLLAKPFTSQALLDAVRQSLSRAPTG